MTQDMTDGKPFPLLIKFCIPLLLGNIFQQFYNLVDTVIVGQYLGIESLTAVGATSSINFLIMGFCTGVCSGFAIPVAQWFGAKDYSRMRRTIMNSVYLSAAFALVLTVLTVIFCQEMLAFMQTPQEILQESCQYMIIILAGLPFTFLYNATAGIIRAMGDSRTPFYFLAVATFLNVVLDLVFIIPCEMGVAGAAYATVLAQAVSGILCLFYMKKKFTILRTTAEERRLSKSCLKKLVVIGVPLGLQSAITSIGSIMLQSSVNSLGIVYVSAYTALVKIKQFTICPYSAFDTAMATYTSQNYGAGKYDRVQKGIRSGMGIYAVYSLAMAIILTLAGDKIALIFVDRSETEVLFCVWLFFQCCGVFYLAIIVLNCLRAVIQGLGYGAASMLAGLCELLARVVMALVFIPRFGYIAVCFTDGAAWILAGICVTVTYFQIRKKIGSKMVRPCENI